MHQFLEFFWNILLLLLHNSTVEVSELYSNQRPVSSKLIMEEVKEKIMEDDI